MDKDFSELIEYLNKKFNGVDEKFDGVDEKFDGVHKRFDKLFDVFATKENIQEIVKNLSTKEDFNNLLNAVDAYAKKADTYFQEMVMLAHKVDRHEKWIQQLAEKLGVKLER